MQHVGKWFARVIGAVAMLLLCVAAVGCLAFPSKMTLRRYGNGGATIQNADVDLSFIQVGVTTRDEISKKLRVIDANAPTGFFWGRWVESSWGVVGGSLPLSSSEAPAVGSMRHWRYRNVLVQFNDQGIAIEQREVDNEEALWHQLISYMRESHMRWPSETIRIPSTEKTDTYAILSADGMQLKAPNRKDSLSVTFPSSVRIHLRSQFRAQALKIPELTCFEMNIADAGAGLKRSFKSCASARQFLAILAYLDHLPAPAKWHEKPQ